MLVIILPQRMRNGADDASAILAPASNLRPCRGMQLIEAGHLAFGVICRCRHLLAQLLFQLLLLSDGCLGLAHLGWHQT